MPRGELTLSQVFVPSFLEIYSISSFLDERSIFVFLSNAPLCRAGKFVNHKGRNRHFTNPEELEEQRRQEEKKQQWRVSIFRLIDTKRVIME